MKTFQDMILAEIKHAITSIAPLPRFSVTQSPNWANDGTVNIHLNASPTPVARIHYHFQPGTYTLKIQVGDRFIPSQRGRSDYFDFYQKVEQPTRFWDALEDVLKQLQGEARGNRLISKEGGQ